MTKLNNEISVIFFGLFELFPSENEPIKPGVSVGMLKNLRLFDGARRLLTDVQNGYL